jgi:cytochrome b561
VNRALPTRLLHLLLAAAIVHQLAINLLMQKPEPGRPEKLGFELHQGVGLASAGILVIFWHWVKRMFSMRKPLASIDEQREGTP